MGLMKFSSNGLKQIKQIFHAAVLNGEFLGKSLEGSYMTDLLQAVINSDQKITAVPFYSEWVGVDTVSDLNSNITIERLSLSGIHQ